MKTYEHEAQMRFSVVLSHAALALLLRVPTFADLAAIHVKALPQEATVLNSLDDATQLEPYSKSWTVKWNYPVAKEDVVARLGKDLGFLTFASKIHPDNAELLLLTGLVARYAYNVDVAGSYDTAMNSLAQAEKLAPFDVRASWFRATLECQTDEPTKGGEDFLSIEATHDQQQLPPAFWDDYMACASVTNMPAHLLRAADHLRELGVPDDGFRTFLSGIAQKRFVPFDPAKKYEPRQIWSGHQILGDQVQFTSTTCGISMKVYGTWQVQDIELISGTCTAVFNTGPYQATTRKLQPSILVMVQQPQRKVTLAEFAKKFQTKGTFEPDTSSHCPVDSCISMRGVQPKMYQKDGDGHGRILFFERDEPQFPGLIFESPEGPPTDFASKGVGYLRPNEIPQRITGKLFYVIVLDTAASIEEQATRDFEFFLQHLTVE